MFEINNELSNVIENSDVYQTGVDLSFGVRTNYLILFTARSGSSWLTKKLSGIFGFPDEHINPQHIAEVATAVGTADPRKLLHSLRGHTATNGIFGIEATSDHLEFFGEEIFFSAIPDLKVFHLFREDIVRQAVSLYRAVSTGHFHSTVGSGSKPDKIELPEMMEWMRHLAGVENKNVELCVQRDLQPINITYETLFRDVEKTIQLFQESLGPVDYKLPTEQTNLAPVSDEWNDWAADVLLRAYPYEIAAIEASRKVKQLGWKSIIG